MSVSINYTLFSPKQEKKDPNTILLLHGDSINDVSKNNLIPTNNGVVVSNAKSKFGPSSLYFGGTGQNLIFNSPSVFSSLMHKPPFTIDWWEYRMNNEGLVLLNYYVGSPYDNAQLAFYIGALNIFDCYNKDTGGQMGWMSPSGTPMLNTWVHWALVMINEFDLMMYQNGKRIMYYSRGNPSNHYEIGPGNLYLSLKENNPSAGVSFKGYVDEFRISNVVRWNKESFTPPTAPYN